VVRVAELRRGISRARRGQHCGRGGLFAQQALDDPHIRAAGLLEEVTFPGLDSTMPLAPTPIELSESPGAYRRRAPLVGEHTDEILTSLGYAAAEIAALREERVI
jgi:crotonobetainyl-CoA:carnitine CoA-transferase CaiB-like acyl-CoA transferase